MRKGFIIGVTLVLLVAGIFLVLMLSNLGESSSINILDESGKPTSENVMLKNPGYENYDMIAKFKDDKTNEEVLEFNLKSHKSVDEIKKVARGNSVVMWYEINSVYGLDKALGEPEFIDMHTGENVEREWSYVYQTKEEYESPVYTCEEEIVSNGTKQNCYQSGTETKYKDVWKPYSSKDIPKGKTIIGISVEVLKGDYIDGIWNVGNLKIDKHATWTETLETDLIAYYTMNDSSSPITDSHQGFDGTESGTPTYGKTGLIGDAIYFSGNDAFDLDGINSTSQSYTFSFWINSSHVYSGAAKLFDFETGRFIIETAQFDDISKFGFYDGTQTPMIKNPFTTGEFVHLVLVLDDSSSNATVYTNGYANKSVAYSGVNLGGNVAFGSVHGLNGAFVKEATIDEVAIWERVLTYDEIQDLYSGGNGLTYRGESDNAPTVTLNSPPDNSVFREINVTMNCSATDDGLVENVTLYIDGMKNKTVTGSSDFLELSEDLLFGEGNYDWTCNAVDDENGMGWATNQTFSIDLTSPEVNVTSPIIVEYHRKNQNLTIEWNVSDVHLDSCIGSYDHGLNNFSLTCLDKNITIGITSSSNNSFYFWANDSAGNGANSSRTWDYKIFEDSRTFTSSLFETETENYAVNVSANASLTSINLIWNSTAYAMTDQGGGNWTYTRDMPLGNGTFNLNYNYTYAGSVINSTTSSQEVNFTYFTKTNATYSTSFLNITFKDENSLANINASIPTSTFVYYLGTGAINKTLTFINNTDHMSYSFSGTTGGRSLNVIPEVQYRRVNDYPQRIWEPGLQTYNSTTSEKTLYLLNTDDGIYVTYQVLTVAEVPISGVEVTSTRVVSGETIQVGAGTTSADGTVTFWMNPDFEHTSVFSKTGYDTYTFTHFPTQASYTITLGSEVELEDDCYREITQTIRPISDFLYRNNIYNFNYTVSSTSWNLTSFQLTITNSSGSSLGSSSSTTASGGTLSVNNINISSSATITASYFYEIDSDESDDCGQISGTRVWITQTTTGTEYSIWQVTQDLNTYISASLFGIDNFGKTLLSFIIIVLMVGGLSKRYGIASEGAIMGILFGIVFFLDVGLGFIPKVEIGDIVSINHFFTFLTFLILMVIVIGEERR